jgi:hypothetical protein
MELALERKSLMLLPPPLPPPLRDVVVVFSLYHREMLVVSDA